MVAGACRRAAPAGGVAATEAGSWIGRAVEAVDVGPLSCAGTSCVARAVGQLTSDLGSIGTRLLPRTWRVLEVATNASGRQLLLPPRPSRAEASTRVASAPGFC
jgi:hypothetical protein